MKGVWHALKKKMNRQKTGNLYRLKYWALWHIFLVKILGRSLCNMKYFQSQVLGEKSAFLCLSMQASRLPKYQRNLYIKMNTEVFWMLFTKEYFLNVLNFSWQLHKYYVSDMKGVNGIASIDRFDVPKLHNTFFRHLWAPLSLLNKGPYPLKLKKKMMWRCLRPPLPPKVLGNLGTTRYVDFGLLVNEKIRLTDYNV